MRSVRRIVAHRCSMRGRSPQQCWPWFWARAAIGWRDRERIEWRQSRLRPVLRAACDSSSRVGAGLSRADLGRDCGAVGGHARLPNRAGSRRASRHARKRSIEAQHRSRASHALDGVGRRLRGQRGGNNLQRGAPCRRRGDCRQCRARAGERFRWVTRERARDGGCRARAQGAPTGSMFPISLPLRQCRRHPKELPRSSPSTVRQPVRRRLRPTTLHSSRAIACATSRSARDSGAFGVFGVARSAGSKAARTAR